MKKTVYTLCIDNYEPEITKQTFPMMERYANKIGADFYIICGRKYPSEYPIPFEKFQMYNLSKERGDDWSIFFDADTLVHPDFWDVTATIGKDTTVSGYTSDFTPQRFRPDEYFMRDGRFIGKGNWFMIFSDWCRDVYHPLDIPLEAAVKNISVIQQEAAIGMRADHLLDDYAVSRNISRFGLKHMLLSQLQQRHGVGIPPLLHWYIADLGLFAPQDNNPAAGFTTPELQEIMTRYGKPLNELTNSDRKAELIRLNLSRWGIKTCAQ